MILIAFKKPITGMLEPILTWKEIRTQKSSTTKQCNMHIALYIIHISYLYLPIYHNVCTRLVRKQNNAEVELLVFEVLD